MFEQKDCDFFKENGYHIIPGFASDEECDALRAECAKLVQEFDPSKHPACVFTTNEVQNRDEYFLTSADKIRYFLEEKAMGEDGKLTVDKEHCLNKIGHALHDLNPVFEKFSKAEKFVDIMRKIGYEHPSIVQSMYIFKQPRIGGKVTAHQDSTFLRTEPSSCTGFWIALEDCTKENGCLWFIPKSHNNGVPDRQFQRTEDGKSTCFVGEPVEYKDEDFICGEVKKGTLVMIHGEVVHKSSENFSEKSRHIYTYHAIELGKGVKYDPKNWLQATKELPFKPLY
eukprot:Nk52_evm9s224 gene=Nk52_evmTU9s224